MLFSVVICTHNRASTLRRCLATTSTLLPPQGGPWELIVVDNASTDNTREVVEELATRADIPVRYVYEPRLGHSVALNTGIRACRGEVIAFTDDDALPVPDWLRYIEAALATYEADWVFGKVVPEWDGLPPRWFSPRFNPHFALLDYGPEPFVATRQHPFFGVNHACRSSALARIGTYREDLGLVGALSGEGNEIDLFRRALAAGLQVVYEPAALVRHVIAPERQTKKYWRHRNWAIAGHLYQQLLADPPAVPWLLGLPRYSYRFALGDLGSYLKGLLTLDRSKAFYHEMYVLRFLGMLYQAGRHGFRNAVPERPAPNATT
jgi:glycosyltransferase involved in cell wall biosynthesis